VTSRALLQARCVAHHGACIIMLIKLAWHARYCKFKMSAGDHTGRAQNRRGSTKMPGGWWAWRQSLPIELSAPHPNAPLRPDGLASPQAGHTSIYLAQDRVHRSQVCLWIDGLRGWSGLPARARSRFLVNERVAASATRRCRSALACNDEWGPPGRRSGRAATASSHGVGSSRRRGCNPCESAR